MSDSEQITHLIAMIHMAADSAHNSTVSSTGYLDRLQKEIDSGGFAAYGTLEIMMLEKSEKYLRETADKIERARLQLLSNHKCLRPEIKIKPGDITYVRRIDFAREPF